MDEWKVFSSNLSAYSQTTIWIDILWFILVIIISPALFLFTMAINELPVLLVRHIAQVIRRTKEDSTWMR